MAQARLRRGRALRDGRLSTLRGPPFFQAARAMAVVQGRHYVIPEDVRELRHAVLRHRLHLSFEALADRVQPESLIDAVFRAVPTP